MLNFIKYYLNAKTKHHVDSLFTFDFMSEVLEDDRHFYAFDEMLTFYHWLEKNKQEVIWETAKKPVKSIFKSLKVNDLMGTLFFRMANYYQYQNIIEIGNGLHGIWMAQAVPNSKLLLINEEKDWANTLKDYCDKQSWNFEMMVDNQLNNEINISVKMTNVNVVILNSIPINTNLETIFEMILPYLINNTLVIVNQKDQINLKIWEQLKTHSNVKRTLDLFQFGLIYFDDGQKDVAHLQIIDKSWKPWSGRSF